MTDNVNHPAHYAGNKTFGHECIDFAQYMPFCLGNCFKYVWRAEYKGHPQEDIAKALWYWEREKAASPTNSTDDNAALHCLYNGVTARRLYNVERLDSDRENALLYILRYSVFPAIRDEADHCIRQYAEHLKAKEETK